MVSDCSIALISNVNVEPIAKLLEQQGVSVWRPYGYGDVFGGLVAAVNRETAPDAVVVLVDTTSVLLAECEKAGAEREIDSWFGALETVLPDNITVFVSDAVCRVEPYCGDWREQPSRDIEEYWNTRLREFMGQHDNVFRFPLSETAFQMGKDRFFSSKMWYLARMPHTFSAQRVIAQKVLQCAKSNRPAMKLLAVDLDNTLWGGVVGEVGSNGIELSDEHAGLAFKDVQRELKKMQRAGVLLAVVSKNNEVDAIDAIDENSHMILHRNDFAASRINWSRKDENIVSIVNDLNIGADSVVFLDDSPVERGVIAAALPEVRVLEFPEDPTELPSVISDAFDRYFKQRRITEEDRSKTEQYAAIERGAELKRCAGDVGSYLESLEMTARLVDAREHLPRIAQLIGKTNQFNLTTKRHLQEELSYHLESGDWTIYAFDIADRFADNGITAVVIVRMEEVPIVDTFLMSCRIMGRGVEDYVLGFIEEDLRSRGVVTLRAEYRPSQKNAPVRTFYQERGYLCAGRDGEFELFEIDLTSSRSRNSYVRKV